MRTMSKSAAATQRLHLFTLLAMVTGCCLREVAANNDHFKYSVTNPASSQHNYVQHIIPGFPSLDVSMCSWFKIHSIPQSTLVGFISIALDGTYEYSNHIYLSLTQTLRISVHHYYVSAARTTTNAGQTVSIGVWSYICFVSEYKGIDDGHDAFLLTVRLMTVESYGIWKWKHDYYFRTSMVPYNPEKTASLIMFNDQDSFGGGLHDDEGVAGTIVSLNIWRSVLSCEELLQASDGQNEGDVYTLSSSTSTLHGEVTGESSAPEFLQVATGTYGRVYTASSSWLKTFSGNRMTGLNLEVFDGTSLSVCAQICLSRVECHSINFAAINMTCELVGDICQPENEYYLTSVTGWDHLSMDAN